MDGYKNFCVNLKLKSTLITLFQSDTLFGHICWAIRYLKWDGEKGCQKLEEFLSNYDKNPLKPPLLISDGFPKDFLSKPIIRPITQEELETILEDNDLVESSYKIKTIKKMTLIPKEVFEELNQQTITSFGLFKKLFRRFEEIEKDRFKKEVVFHNTINRISNTVTSGLYQQEELFFKPGFDEFEVYLKTNYFSKQDLERIFGFIAKSGYGRDKSTGKGNFFVEIVDNGEIKGANTTNAFMTLASYIPHQNAPIEGYYDIVLKYGKLGGDFAKSDPFKVPLIMFKSGSTFYDKDYSSDKIYGSLLKKVHRKNPNIKHYAYAFPIGVNIEDVRDE